MSVAAVTTAATSVPGRSAPLDSASDAAAIAKAKTAIATMPLKALQTRNRRERNATCRATQATETVTSTRVARAVGGVTTKRKRVPSATPAGTARRK